MGLQRLGSELKKARGTLSQKAAAKHWQVPYSTLCAIEQGQARNYQPQTLAHFDDMLGRSAWDLYDQPDEAGWDVPAASVASVEELRARLDELERLVRDASRRPDPLGALIAELTAAELDDVVAFAHFLRARRGGDA